MNRPRISKLNTWGRHEKELLSVLDQSLISLQATEHVTSNETNINRKLYIELRTEVATRKLNYTIHSESSNQPLLDEEEDKIRERKIPDIQVSWTDPQAENIANYQRQYAIECKRLGSPVSSRVFNKEYVINGVQRFVSRGHGYAKGTLSGVMVGYVQSMDINDIVMEVNSSLSGITLPNIQFDQSSWIESGSNRHSQKINRPEVEPSNFELHHLWVDLRKTLKA